MRNTREDLLKETQLIQACTTTLRAVLANATIVSGGKGKIQSADGQMTIRGPWGVKEFVLESKRRITTATVKPLIARILSPSRFSSSISCTSLPRNTTATSSCPESATGSDPTGGWPPFQLALWGFLHWR